jgi:tetratricopeptide (TPR) repeat protein
MKFRILTCVFSLVIGTGLCQETVFGLLKNDAAMADEYFGIKNYRQALVLYLKLADRNASTENDVKIARSYFFLRDYRRAIPYFQKRSDSLNASDRYYYAESLAASRQYEEAVAQYALCAKEAQGDKERILKKIWQLKNARFLYEDSVHFVVRAIPINTANSELCAVPYGNGLVFLAARNEVKVITDIDATSGSSFYQWYYTEVLTDSMARMRYNEPVRFKKEFNVKFHAGPIAFYNKNSKAVYAATRNQPGPDGGRTLQIYFAERVGETWKKTAEFAHNSTHYSLTDPSISEDGTVLYFSSDMKGGFGGKDLYKSEFRNNKWTKPINLGDQINTPGDETFPYLHQDRVLYFSSNGQAGLGGMDIFKTVIASNLYGEIENAGYPLNSPADDFALVLDSLGVHGYLTSNRKDNGNNDDIYEVDIDLQTYPLVLHGIVKYKEHNWSDSSEIKILPNAKLTLIDNVRNVPVQEMVSDSAGNFSMEIPYFSKYKIRIITADNEENIVSLEIPKHRVLDTKHEIVVVKDPFTHSGNEAIK